MIMNSLGGLGLTEIRKYVGEDEPTMTKRSDESYPPNDLWCGKDAEDLFCFA